MELIKCANNHPGILEITLNRPEKRNALNIALIDQLCSAIADAERDTSLRVIVLQGTGHVFCAGMDLFEAQDPKHTDRLTDAVSRMLKQVYHCPLVTIAAVHGSAFAGGAGLMAACDYVIADVDTVFGFPETRRGLVAAQIMAVLYRRIPPYALRELLLFAESINAPKALEMGLINLIAPKEIHVAEIFRWAGYAIKGAPGATKYSKQLIETFFSRAFDADISEAIQMHHRVRQSEEAKEGIAAFFEKREPNWIVRGDK